MKTKEKTLYMDRLEGLTPKQVRVRLLDFSGALFLEKDLPDFDPALTPIIQYNEVFNPSGFYPRRFVYSGVLKASDVCVGDVVLYTETFTYNLPAERTT